jgi:putative ABC transport system permease protein
VPLLELFHTVAARVRGYFFRRQRDLDEADFEQEMAAHLQMAEEDGLRRGLSVEEARRAARVQLGGVTQLRESWRAASGLAWLDSFVLDAKLGLRMLRRSWGLTIAGGLAMTIVITIAAVVFVFLDQFMGRTAPPLDEGERVVALQSWDAEAHRRTDMSRSDLERWSTALRSVVDLGGFQTSERRLMVDGRPAEWVRVAEITASGFRLARVQPLLGRWIAEADEHAGVAPVVVIGYDVWQSRFGSDRAVVGQTVRLGEVVHTVVGVMPEGFAFPVNHRYWIPLRTDPAGSLKAAPQGAVFGRLAPGVSLERAQAELATVGLLPPATVPPNADARRARVVPYTFAFTDDVEHGELAWQQRIILLLVSLLLVPPCLNIAILIYARTVTRQEEFAARFALGASRARIVAQLCIEVFMLSSVAGLVALALTRPILTQIGEIISRFPEIGGSLPFWVNFDFSWRAAIFVAGLTVLAALIAGLAPALQATGRVLPAVLRSLGSRTGIPLGTTWTALIVTQVAFALAALPSTIELVWGHLRPTVLGPGFAARNILTARLSVNSPPMPMAEADRTAFASRARTLQAEALRQIGAEFGVSAVTYATALPGAEPLTLIEMEEGAASGRSRVRRYMRANQVDRAFFDVLDTQALAGRTFQTGDFGLTPAMTAIVDQTFVEQVSGGDDDRSIIGRRVRPVAAPGAEAGPWYEIVGIVPDRPANTSQGRMYVPAAPLLSGARPGPVESRPIQLAMRTGPDAAAMLRRIQAITTNLDPALRLDDVRRLDEVLGETQLSSNLTSYALAIVMLSVLILSAAGLYALMSFTVTLRRREIGIRTALGAQPWRLLGGIFARAMWQIAGGVLVGVTVALVLHQWLNIEVEGGWHIPGILPAAAIFIMMIGLVSAAGPARRAVRVDPTEALRDG